MRDSNVEYQERMDRASRLRKARKNRFKSMEAAAKFYKWSNSTLQSHEKGGRKFKYEWAEKYAEALGVDINWLWNGGEVLSERAPTGTSNAATVSQESSSRSADLRWPENSETFLKSEMEALGLCLAHAKELLELVQRTLEEHRVCRRSIAILPTSPQ
jgi:hypothetical protein